MVEGVPVGGEDDYVELKQVGTRRDFAAEGFAPADHLEIGERLGAIDMARGAKVSGARFYFLTGAGARLRARAAQPRDGHRDGQRVHARHHAHAGAARGDGRHRVPRRARLARSTGSRPTTCTWWAPRRWRSRACTPTRSSTSTAGPLRYAGWSACYRREAGSHGRDTRGIIRVHQFHKVEMFVYCRAEDAEAEHQRLLGWEEQMLAAVELPYRVIDTAAGDLGSSAARKFDCEAWLPTQERWLELTSTSNCTTFQARRLAVRERTEGGTRPVATLNGTLGTTRWIVALLENHQQADGSVHVPEALRPYLGGLEVLEPVARG